MGLARITDRDNGDHDRLTDSGTVLGTGNYVAPEQARDTRMATGQSDVYSLGCTLFRLLIGRAPYHGESLLNVLLAHREEPVPSLRENRPEVPQWLDEVFRRMVAKRPEDRYQSMQDVIDDLERHPLPKADLTSGTIVRNQ